MKEIIRNIQETSKAVPSDPRLLDYVTQCRKMRIADEEIRKKLLKVGWAAEEADRILGKLKAESDMSVISSNAGSVSGENIESNKLNEEEIRKEFLKKESRSKLFSKRTIIIIFFVLLLLLALAFVVYYFLSGKNNPVFKNKESEKNTAEVKEVDCSAKKFKKPKGTGPAVLRVDSTMKLLLDAVNEGNYCLAMSLFSNDSRDKHKDLIKKVLENEGKRIKFAQDLKDYMIPPINENDPSGQAKATVTSSEGINKQFYSIILSKEETGEYLITSM